MKIESILENITQETKERRKQLGITQAKLSVITGVSKPTIIGFEKGKSIRLDSFIMIRVALGMLRESQKDVKNFELI